MVDSKVLIRTLLLCNFFLLSQSLDFKFHGFSSTDLIKLDGDATLQNSTVRLTGDSSRKIGHAFYPHPIPMLNNTSFSTNFVFQINPNSNNDGGFGLAFTLSPSPEFPGGADGQFLGVFNRFTNGSSSNNIFMVEFDTVAGAEEGTDRDGSHVGINFNGLNSTRKEAPEVNNENVDLQKAKPIHAWINYDANTKMLTVSINRINNGRTTKPSDPLISLCVNDQMQGVMKEEMYAGFSAATGPILSSSHYILGWSFRLNGAADQLDLSLLPTVPPMNKSTSSKLKTPLIATFSVVLFFSVASLIGILVYRRSTKYEELEEWELNSPHRFRYKDLHRATKGFKESERIGAGGFGTVYKGVLPSTGVEVAVKKITSNNKLQGMREFAAEIESLGRLRHKNLVHLQGWCKHKNDLLLVYDYIPNGSLDSLLYYSRMRNSHSGAVLSWEQRFNVVKGVASGLLYLHEEWEQVVIHRDVKSSMLNEDNDSN